MNNTQINADAIWQSIRNEASDISVSELMLAQLLKLTVLDCSTIFECIAVRISRKLGKNAVSAQDFQKVFMEAFDADEQIRNNIVADLVAINLRDPACDSYLTPILYFKGFQSITTHRVAHWLWMNNRKALA